MKTVVVMTEHEQCYCRKCGVELIENDNWSPSYASSNRRICRSCHAKRCKENHEKRKEEQGKYRLKQMYGIDEAEWNRMFDAQQGRCAICDSPEPEGKHGVFCVDHCHETGKVRGLLCHSCNTALGLFRDNKDTLKNAIEYLEVHE